MGIFSGCQLGSRLAAEDALHEAEQKLDDQQRDEVFRWLLSEPELSDDASFEILEGPTRMYGEIEMHQVGFLVIDPAAVANGGPYTESTAERNNWFESWKGTEVYELTDPAGERYHQRSVAQYIEPLTLEDLPTLGDRLELPEGWSWQAYVLEEDWRIEVDGIATVIQDELGNTYQKIVE